MTNYLQRIIIVFAVFTVSTTTYSQRDKVDDAINKVMQKNKIVGLQLAVIKDNKIVKTSQYGLANIEDSIAVDSETVFSINSMTKSFTGVAIMQLVERGKLRLDDPISKYLNNLPASWQNITVKQIATHTSGIPDIWEKPEQMWSNDSAILFQKIKEQPIVFKAGEEQRYNQTNFLLLGMIIEKISGQTFEEFVIKNQFEIAGMKKSIRAGMGDFFSIINHSAKPYTYYINGSLTNIYQPMPKNLYPAGGIFSTATEMAQWAIALQTNKLISVENLKILMAPTSLKDGVIHEGTGFFNQSSIGFFLATKTNMPVIATFGGARNALFIYPKDNITVVVLSNLVGARPQDFIGEIANLYLTDK
ncbi:MULTISPECIES: serine hydrolase domain-containing protein [unclassified Flavobacterium]|uniref:serine hydrolase domain-containing protein n=1 Tax=unclassified Flavobacterium TaxID=196869 RepID=UPI003F8DF617